MKVAWLFAVSTLVLFALGSSVMADGTPKLLFDFTGADAAREWQNIYDGVMGGISEGKFKVTGKKTLEFYGTLSLENNGGFASVRSKPGKLGLEKGDVLLVRLREDGREYSMNLYVPRPLVAFSYRSMIRTKKEEWMEVQLSLDRFVATRFGKPTEGAGPVDPPEVNGLGFLLGDKKAGPFKLEVEWIRVVRGGKGQ